MFLGLEALKLIQNLYEEAERKKPVNRKAALDELDGKFKGGKKAILAAIAKLEAPTALDRLEEINSQQESLQEEFDVSAAELRETFEILAVEKENLQPEVEVLIRRGIMDEFEEGRARLQNSAASLTSALEDYALNRDSLDSFATEAFAVGVTFDLPKVPDPVKDLINGGVREVLGQLGVDIESVSDGALDDRPEDLSVSETSDESETDETDVTLEIPEDVETEEPEDDSDGLDDSVLSKEEYLKAAYAAANPSGWSWPLFHDNLLAAGEQAPHRFDFARQARRWMEAEFTTVNFRGDGEDTGKTSRILKKIESERPSIEPEPTEVVSDESDGEELASDDFSEVSAESSASEDVPAPDGLPVVGLDDEGDESDSDDASPSVEDEGDESDSKDESTSIYDNEKYFRWLTKTKLFEDYPTVDDFINQFCPWVFKLSDDLIKWWSDRDPKVNKVFLEYELRGDQESAS